MAKRTKRTKKAKSKPTKPPGPAELEGYKLGDTVHAKWITGDKVGYGPIKEFHIKCAEGLAFTFWDEINGGFRTTLLENIIDEPTGRQLGSLKRARNRKR